MTITNTNGSEVSLSPVSVCIIEANLSFQALLGYRSFQIGCIFAEYDLFKTLNLIPNLTYLKLLV